MEKKFLSALLLAALSTIVISTSPAKSLAEDTVLSANSEETARMSMLIKQNENYFNNCYSAAMNGQTYENALLSSGIIKDDSDVNSIGNIRASLCGSAFEAAQLNMPDDIRSFFQLIRHKAYCSSVDSDLRQIRTALEFYQTDKGMYPNSTKTLKTALANDSSVNISLFKGNQITLADNVTILFKLDRKGKQFSAQATHPECEFLSYTNSSDIGITSKLKASVHLNKSVNVGEIKPTQKEICATTKSEANNIATNLEAYFADHQEYPDNLAKVNIPVQDGVKATYNIENGVYKLSVEHSGCNQIYIKYSDKSELMSVNK